MIGYRFLYPAEEEITEASLFYQLPRWDLESFPA
jgi:hypothetical protein